MARILADDAHLAVAADRNPWIVSPASAPGSWAKFRPDIAIWPGWMPGNSDQACAGNSITHRRDGQNVLFLDGRVTFEKRAYCGVDKDNIYTISSDLYKGDPWGRSLPIPVGSACVPANRNDSVLVHDPPFVYSQERR